MALVERRDDEDWQLSKSCIQERFKQLLHLSRWTDCSFRVGHLNVEVIHSHKLVLAVSSPVFEALFFGPLSSPGDTIITVPDIEPHTFKALLKYVYSDEAGLRSIDQVGDLLYAAKKYLVEPLSKLCLDYLVQHTWIRTLWEVMDVALTLNEEKLITACLKVMSRYHYEVWRSEDEHLSTEMLCRLLDLPDMNMSEMDLWDMVVEWAEKEVTLRGLPNNPQSKRQVILEARLLPRFRFLALQHDLLGSLCPILSQEEVQAIKEKRAPLDMCSSEVTCRGSALPMIWRSTRQVLSRKSDVWINRAEVICKISSSIRVLVIGFEVLTRVSVQLTPYGKTTGYNSTYREKFSISIKDSKGRLLQVTEYDTSVPFGMSQNIHLKKPMWFEENVMYTVSIGYIGGQYPFCLLASECTSWSDAKFYFEEMIILEGLPQKIFSNFVVSVLYAI